MKPSAATAEAAPASVASSNAGSAAEAEESLRDDDDDDSAGGREDEEANADDEDEDESALLVMVGATAVTSRSTIVKRLPRSCPSRSGASTYAKLPARNSGKRRPASILRAVMPRAAHVTSCTGPMGQVCQMSDVGCQMSDARCQMSDVKCQVSDVKCQRTIRVQIATF